MMKKQENQLAAKPLNLYDIEQMVPVPIKRAFFGHSYNEIKAAVMWYAANRNRYNKDADSTKLVEELNYIDMKDTFYKKHGLKSDAPCREVFEVMCRLADMPNPNIYYGLNDGASTFSKIRSGDRKLTRRMITNFSVNMKIDECYARMLFEANGMTMTEKDRESYRKGINDPLDLGYLDVYKKKGAKEGAGR